MPKPILRSDVLKFEDLQIGQELTGTVRNITDFGAFVDVGVKHDGLVHISELSDKFVKNPSEIVSIGDIVKVKVIDIDFEKQKVKLSMKGIPNNNLKIKNTIITPKENPFLTGFFYFYNNIHCCCY